MSILIKGMEMPGSCWRCLLSQLYEKPREMLVCKITHEEVLRHKIDGNCPLVPVPPHGRLIDVDEYRDEFMNGVYELCNDDTDNYRANAIIDLFDYAPTIIEAEGTNDGN